eukprot:g2564.t1
MTTKDGQPWTDYVLAGGTAGMVARTVIAPVERVKILYQIQRKGGARMTSWLPLLPRIVREEGVLACWKGNSAAITRVVPYMSVQFLSFEKFKPMVGMAGGVASCGTTTNNVIAGSCAGLVAVMLTYPLDTVRARMAAQQAGVAKARYDSMFDALVRLPRERGIGSLYKGMGATMVGVAPYAGLKFGTYEGLKTLAASAMNGGDGTAGVQELSATVRMGCGVLAGALAQTFVYPFDVIRRRFQTSDATPYKGVWDALVTIAREEGISQGLFRGLSLNYLKTIPNVAVYMSLYDVLKLQLAERRARENDG